MRRVLPRVLLYGFGPYETFSENVSQEILKRVRTKKTITVRIFPVIFRKSVFLSVLEQVQPDYIIGLGQHPRARKIRVERQAMNWMTPGRRLPGHAIEPGLPKQAYSTLPLPRLPELTTSYSAGTFVCNYSMWQMHRWCQTQDARWAFLHIPKRYEIEQGCEVMREILLKIEARFVSRTA